MNSCFFLRFLIYSFVLVIATSSFASFFSSFVSVKSLASFFFASFLLFFCSFQFSLQNEGASNEYRHIRNNCIYLLHVLQLKTATGLPLLSFLLFRIAVVARIHFLLMLSYRFKKKKKKKKKKRRSFPQINAIAS